MEYLYHGSAVAGITTLATRSLLHNSDKKVVYLTGSLPFALVYIWDGRHNHYDRKHVSGGIRNGTAFYEEWFPDQLKVFYKNVSGYVYCVRNCTDFQPVENRGNMLYSEHDVSVDHVVFIPDVYEEILKYEKSGRFTVLRYNEQTEERQRELVDLMASFILANKFFQDDTAQAEFMKKYFVMAWEKAEKGNIL